MDLNNVLNFVNNLHFFIYAAIFRLAITGAGFGCIFMGYRLFVLGFMPKSSSDINIKYSGARFIITNVAPGSFFAICGVAMIFAMVVQGNPLLTIDRNRLATNGATVSNSIPAATVNNPVITEEKITTRSGEMYIYDVIRRGKQREQSNQFKEAIKIYLEPFKNGTFSIKDVAELMRAIAGVYLKEGRYDEAIALAWLADQSDPNNAEGLALISKIEFHRGNYERAEEKISQAARINSGFVVERDELKEKIRNQEP